MYEDFFRKRLLTLRKNKKVSAREMSLSLGQNPGYINSIEMGKTFPSMSGFFYICEYLDITPQEFFDENTAYPKELTHIVSRLRTLDKKHLDLITEIAYALPDEDT